MPYPADAAQAGCFVGTPQPQVADSWLLLLALHDHGIAMHRHPEEAFVRLVVLPFIISRYTSGAFRTYIRTAKLEKVRSRDTWIAFAKRLHGDRVPGLAKSLPVPARTQRSLG